LVAGLQWSHVLSDVDSICDAKRFDPERALQWSHVLSDVDRQSPPTRRWRWRRRFNGATSFRTWIDFRNRLQVAHFQPASMEPRPFGRG